MTMSKILLAAVSLVALGGASNAPAPSLQLARLSRIATVDARYQGYNIEMVEVTGGEFWAPYGGPPDEVHRQRPPIDLTDPRLVALARGLGPSLLRVSGTWANNTYLLAEGEVLSTPPAGYKQILTRDQWRNVIAFSKAVDAPLVTSFAASAGTRGADGVWQAGQAQRLVDLTRAAGGSIYAAEFFNEPNIPGATVGMPPGYDVPNYATEFRIFRDWARKALPGTKLLGTGGVSEGTLMKNPPAIIRGGKFLSSEAMLAANPGSLDVVSYHFYGTVSPRCGGPASLEAARVEAMTPQWLDKTLIDADFYSRLRDKHEPGKPMWNTETAQAACGGAPWASTFLDTFRYLNQNAALAQKGVQVVMHNTLAASDYALVDRDTLTPRPNYWAAVLWRRTMGTTVLASPLSPSPALRLYAHCAIGKPGGVAVMALNTGEAPQRLSMGGKAIGWTMTGQPVETRAVRINGNAPALDAKGNLTGLTGVAVAGSVSVPGRSVGFYTVPGANNPACK
jgi:heparanase